MADEPSPTYAALAAPFETTHKRIVGGVELDYLTGEQVATRLNTVLGPSGWSFRVLEHGYNEEADELWALGEIAATIDSVPVLRQQFGSQKLKRSRANSAVLDVGFDLKGAATDAMKKCASLLGVGLYLSHKEELSETPHPGETHPPAQQTKSDPVAASKGAGAPAASAPSDGGLVCQDCGEALQETRFKDGTVWAPAQLAAYGRRKHSRVLCMTHYREANDLLKAAAAG